MLYRLLCVLNLLILFIVMPVSGQEISKLPKVLQDWQDWIMAEEDYRQCPFIFNREEFSCTWVSSTHLQTTAGKLRFQMSLSTYAPRWVSLPGSPKHWPRQVVDEASGKTLAIREKDQRPQVFLPTGQYSLRGEIPWQNIPTSIAIPSNSGIVHLRVEGENVAQPALDNSGQLWLRQDNLGDKKLQRDTQTIQVFRKIEDGNPLKLVTRIVMDISGQAREILTGPFLLNDFIPLQLKSSLPARIEKDGKLRVQVKPGRWTIELNARHLGPLASIQYTQESTLWPNYELWVFQANHSFRRVQIDGAPGIDPSQTLLPQDWQSFPAYRVLAGSPIHLKEIHRGDTSPEADELSLNKSLYLDFDGQAFTVSDQLSGKVRRSWRFDSHPEYALGSASLNGVPQLITDSGDGQSQGIEIRQGQLQLNAVSRLGQTSRLPISGWLMDFKNVSANLHLPPGWSLLATGGVDEVENSWLSQWNLWDIFLVLIIVVAVFRLCGVPSAVLALLTLVLLYHRSEAPLFIWLNLVAVMALLKVTEGKLNAYLAIYQTISFVVLLFILLPFSVTQIRQAVYPQLEERNAGYNDDFAYKLPKPPGKVEAGAPMPAYEEDVQEEEIIVTGIRASRSSRESDEGYDSPISSVAQASRPRVQKFSSAKQEYDPNAIVQTGPGIPNWTWHRINLSWSGPVAQGETLALYLAPPWLNRLGALVVVILAALFAFVIWIHSHIRESMEYFSGARKAAANVIGLVFMSGMLFNSEPAKADVLIDQEMLEQLHEYLTQAPKCLPHCASIEQANVNATGKDIQLEMTVGSMDNIAFGLPAWRSTWLPKNVSLNGKPAIIKYGKGGQLFIRLPKGRHKIVLEGLLLAEQIELRFAVPVHNFTSELQGWELSGAHKGFVKSGTVQLQRLDKSSRNENVLLPDPVPPFVTIYRHFDFAMEWSLVTTVSRVAPQRGAISLEVPLIQSESPISDIPVKEGKATVVLGVNQSSFQWRSTLKKTEALKLIASEQKSWNELWSFNASPIWHVEYEGIAPNKQGNLHSPLWAPWPGEEVNIKISRPQAVKGQDLTIDELNLYHTLGQRSHTSKMVLSLRTSRGQNFPLSLPEGAVFDSVSINGQNQPLISSKEKIDIPLRPGHQSIEIHWHDEKGIANLSTFPQLDIAVPASNIRMEMHVPRDRWSLLVGGPLLGPAVLYWGLLIVVLVAAFFLAKSSLTPLAFHHWALLGIGVTSTNIYTPLIIVAWLFAIGWRGRFSSEISTRRFRVMQIGLILLSLAALISLVVTIPLGLLSSPDMHIVGNGSYAHHLTWFQDRIDGVLPQAWLFSLPLYVYRIVMLLWSLWLAVYLLNWLKWAWEQLQVQGFWK